jgi:quinoprotein glucose dehydrogenase
VYLTTQDWPTIYKLSLEDPLAARRAAGAAGADQGRAIYEKRCQTCHGQNGEGSAGGPPAVGGKSRLALEPFRQIVAGGRAEMPAFADLDAAAITALHAYLENPAGTGRAASTTTSPAARGPVVASGGAPGGLDVPIFENRYTPLGGPPYPAGIDAPQNRYYTDWGLYPNQPYIIGPPWSALVAYDLNSGMIKWRVPLGEDARAAGEGAKDAGVFMAERHGLVVTSTGLIFVATTDGKVRAHDEETGRVLWTAALPAGSEGLPSMYEVNGRQFLIVPASSRINTGGGHRRPGEPPVEPAEGSRSYVAFALPQKPKR